MIHRRSLALALVVSLAWLVWQLGGPGRTGRAEPPAPADVLPVPIEKSNCVRCHLKAGRELTQAVHVFAGSAHDLASLTCNDCHGGNSDDDVAAHEEEFDFIGTKLSAHLEQCRGCHDDVADVFDKSPHFWDQTKRINLDYPICVDCHGNHDVGNPPENFSLGLVCLDCHRDYKTRFAALESVTAENEKLWGSIRGWRRAHLGRKSAVPEALIDELAEIRTQTAAILHPAIDITAEQAADLNAKVRAFRERIEAATPKAP